MPPGHYAPLLQSNNIKVVQFLPLGILKIVLLPSVKFEFQLSAATRTYFAGELPDELLA